MDRVNDKKSIRAQERDVTQGNIRQSLLFHATTICVHQYVPVRTAM